MTSTVLATDYNKTDGVIVKVAVRYFCGKWLGKLLSNLFERSL